MLTSNICLYVKAQLLLVNEHFFMSLYSVSPSFTDIIRDSLVCVALFLFSVLFFDRYSGNEFSAIVYAAFCITYTELMNLWFLDLALRRRTEIEKIILESMKKMEIHNEYSFFTFHFGTKLKELDLYSRLLNEIVLANTVVIIITVIMIVVTPFFFRRSTDL